MGRRPAVLGPTDRAKTAYLPDTVEHLNSVERRFIRIRPSGLVLFALVLFGSSLFHRAVFTFLCFRTALSNGFFIKDPTTDNSRWDQGGLWASSGSCGERIYIGQAGARGSRGYCGQGKRGAKGSGRGLDPGSEICEREPEKQENQQPVPSPDVRCLQIRTEGGSLTNQDPRTCRPAQNYSWRLGQIIIRDLLLYVCRWSTCISEHY